MIIISTVGVFSFLSLMYCTRLMADAKKLQERLPKWFSELSQDGQAGEERLITPDYAMWTALPFSKTKGASGGRTVQFYSPDIEKSGADQDSGGIHKPR